tara:strand:- start:733 stop:918 length:186 start_codon:yes stop_codon:yes gene_type:complete
VERLFRSRHLRVLIATETLSLGINMPCRTVIIHGDFPNLDAQVHDAFSPFYLMLMTFQADK